MIALLLIGAQPIPLINQVDTTDQRGYANIQYWDGGVFIYAHNYMAGGAFYDLTEMTVIDKDGHLTRYEVKQTYIMTDPDEWTRVIMEYSSPETITLTTCYPPNSTGEWYIKEMQRIQEQ